MPTAKTRSIPSIGVGKSDYSTSIESAVEPITRSYQEDFHHTESILALAAGDTETIDVPLKSGYVTMLYDFEISANDNKFISFVISEVNNGIATAILTKGGYQKVTVALSKGFPFFGTVRVVVSNDSLGALDIDFHCHGITLPETEYYLSGGGAPIY